MQGAISLWSTAEFVQQRRRKGFMLNLDFYNCSGQSEWRTASLPRKMEDVSEENE
jgi:hypothetical protein